MRPGAIILAVVALLLAVAPCPAADAPGDAARSAIRSALERWTAAFNARDPDGACALFAPDLIATYPGSVDRDHDAMCRVLAQAIRDPGHSLRYSFEVEEIVVRDDVAVVRLRWTLRETLPGSSRETVVHERGVDLFRRQPDGSWRISWSVAYPEDESAPGDGQQAGAALGSTAAPAAATPAAPAARPGAAAGADAPGGSPR